MFVFEDDGGRIVATLVILAVAIALAAFYLIQRRRRAQRPTAKVHPIQRDETGGPLYIDVWGLRPGQAEIEDERRHRVLDDRASNGADQSRLKTSPILPKGGRGSQ